MARKKAGLTKSWKAFEAYRAKKNRSEGKAARGGGNAGFEFTPSKFLLQLAVIVDTESRSGEKVTATLTDVFGLPMGQPVSAVSCLDELEREMDKAVDHVLELVSSQLSLNAEVLYFWD